MGDAQSGTITGQPLTVQAERVIVQDEKLIVEDKSLIVEDGDRMVDDYQPGGGAGERMVARRRLPCLDLKQHWTALFQIRHGKVMADGPDDKSLASLPSLDGAAEPDHAPLNKFQKQPELF